MREYIEAIFIREEPNRFRGLVEINGHQEICYVPASCKLSKLIKIKNKKVILHRVSKVDSNFEYALYAVKIRNCWVLVNLQQVNQIVYEKLRGRKFSFLGKRTEIFKERTISGYKADIFIENTGSIIEVKTVLSDENRALFPGVYSERSIKQLKKIFLLQDNNFSAYLLIFSLNPKTKEIEINDAMGEYKKILKACVNKGLICKAFSLRLKTNLEPVITNEIPIYGL